MSFSQVEKRFFLSEKKILYRTYIKSSPLSELATYILPINEVKLARG